MDDVKDFVAGLFNEIKQTPPRTKVRPSILKEEQELLSISNDKELPSGFIGSFNYIPDSREYADGAQYRNVNEGVVYINKNNLWEEYVRDGKKGDTPRWSPSGGGLGERDVKLTTGQLGIFNSLAELNDYTTNNPSVVKIGSTASVNSIDYNWNGVSVGWCKKNNNYTPIQSIRNLPTRNIVWWGDSTIENATGNNVIPYNYGPSETFDSLRGFTQHINYGASGYSTTTILNANIGSVNGGGNEITPEGVGARCSDANLLVVSFGINDFRSNIDISVYGNEAFIKSINDFQSRLRLMITRVRNIAGNIPVVLMVPNTLCLTGPLLTGVNGQQVTNAIRAAYIGDTSIGILPLDANIYNSAICDASSLTFGITSPVTNNKPNTMSDELHPSTIGMFLRQVYVATWLDSICLSEEYNIIATGNVIISETNYMDIGFNERISTLFGNTNGTNYGASSPPAIGVGDELVCYLSNGTIKTLRLTEPPYQNNNEYNLRWVNPPNGSWHKNDIPNGTRIVLRRKKYLSTIEAYINRLGYKTYPFRVISGTNGSVSIVGLGGNVLSLVDRAPTTTDYLALPSIGFSGTLSIPGISLSSATIVVGSSVGSYNITIPGIDFVASVNQLGSVIVKQ